MSDTDGYALNPDTGPSPGPPVAARYGRLYGCVMTHEMSADEAAAELIAIEGDMRLCTHLNCRRLLLPDEGRPTLPALARLRTSPEPGERAWYAATLATVDGLAAERQALAARGQRPVVGPGFWRGVVNALLLTVLLCGLLCAFVWWLMAADRFLIGGGQ